MAEYRVDELARAADTSVRNVRVYQDRGLLPPPRRVGRTGVYSESHLSRLRLIRLLLARGYTFATIRELITAHEAGRSVDDLLSLDGAIAAPWSTETPTRMTLSDLAEYLGEVTQESLQRAVELGLLELDEDGAVVRSPRLLDAGRQLTQAGMPLTAVLDLAEVLGEHTSAAAKAIFRVFDQGMQREGTHSDQVLADIVIQARPFAQEAVSALLAMALDRESRSLLAARARRGMREPALGRDDAPDAASSVTTPAS